MVAIQLLFPNLNLSFTSVHTTLLPQKFEEAMIKLESSNEGSTPNSQGQMLPQEQQQQPMSSGDGDEQGMQGGENGNISPEVSLR